VTTGRAGYPNTRWPGLIDFETPDLAPICAPLPISMCPTMPTWPAMTTWSPTTVLPEIPTWATMMQWGPI